MGVIVKADHSLVKGVWGFRVGRVLSYRPDMVNLVLMGFVALSVLVFVFALLWMQGERDNLKRAKELEEIGLEAQAHLTYLQPIRDTGTVSVEYTFRGPNGDEGRYRTGMKVSPVHVLGNTYPLVHHPRLVNRVQMGTMKEVRKERRERAGYVRTAQWMAFTSFTVCALAIGGMVLGP
ncbi:hypothetical protein [Streptomyces sp. NPDC057939]|uniref:hypothetical protein n=1 Tax=Streptomyces sp. NPDC057939 TaxID=3346284 RepID=UPI0036EDF2FC